MIADTKLVFVLACTRDWWMKYAREEVYNNFALRSNAFATWILRLFCLGDKDIRIRMKKTPMCLYYDNNNNGETNNSSNPGQSR